MRSKVHRPIASAIVGSLRSIGYSFDTAVADVIDNSISAHAARITIRLEQLAGEPAVSFRDDGHGMEKDDLIEAMRHGGQGSGRRRESGDLGRYGLGLKTASLSQCRRLTEKRKATNEATESTERKMVMIFELLTQRRVRYASYETNFRKSFRSFQRDIQQLREIGKTCGFELSPMKEGRYVDLLAVDGRGNKLNKDSQRLEGILVAMAQALGEPIVREFGSRVAGENRRDDFFSFAGPKLVDGSAVAEICTTLREACTGPMGRACVKFSFPDTGKTTSSVREVEPYRVIVRSGKYYLLGYDRGRRGWRTFAIDRFKSKPTRAGTCLEKRTVPAEYLSEDAIGFFRGPKRIDVTVELSARVAPTATARLWQADQRVENLKDGRAQLTFSVTDVDEVIRWALGYGNDARLIAPPSAVARALETARQIVKAYEENAAG